MAHMGQGPYGPRPIWAKAHMGQGPYGPGPIWAPGPWAPGPSLLGKHLTKKRTLEKRVQIVFFVCFLETKKMRGVRTIILAAVSRRDLCYVSENKGFRLGKTPPILVIFRYTLPSPPKFKGVPLAEASGRLEPEKVEHLSAKMLHFH